MIWTNQSTETGLIWTKQWTVTALEGELRGGGWRSPQHLPGHGYSGKGREEGLVQPSGGAEGRREDQTDKAGDQQQLCHCHCGECGGLLSAVVTSGLTW